MKKLLTLTAVAALGISSIASAANIVVTTESLERASTKSVEVLGAGTISEHSDFYITPSGTARTADSGSMSDDDESYLVFGVKVNADQAS